MNSLCRSLLSGICAASLLAVTSQAAHAEPIGDPGNSSTKVGPVSNGPTTSQGTAGFNSSGTQATSSSQTGGAPTGPVTVGAPGTGGGSSDIVVQPIPFNQLPGGAQTNGSGPIINNPLNTQQACPAGQTGFFVSAAGGNAPVQVVCVPNQAAPPPQATALSPIQLAQMASGKQSWPNLLVNVNPGRGLTGLPSWFWCAGSPAMPDATASAGPLTVTVHATLADVAWVFGDGTGSGGDLGRPFPAQSTIQHVYQTDSLGLASGYPITVSLRWKVAYSINGGPFNDLGFKTRDYGRSYVVEQLQPQAVSVP
jgi:hypothetical protein